MIYSDGCDAVRFKFTDVTVSYFLLILFIVGGVWGFFVYSFSEFFAGHVYLAFYPIASFFILILYFLRSNLVFFLRILFLATIGYYAGLVKVINIDGAFSPVEIAAQTPVVAIKMLGLTAIGLMGAGLGLFVSASSLFNLRRHWVGIRFGDNAQPIFWISVVLVLVAGYLSARSYGPNVFEASYASGEGEGQALGNLQSIGVISLVLCWMTSNELLDKKLIRFSWMLSVYFLVWGILIRGGRIEVLSGILAILVCVPMLHGKIFGIKLYHCVLGLVGAAFLEVWGSLRSVLSASSASVDLVVSGYKNLSDDNVYHAGTISGIGTTFSNIVHMIDNNVLDFQFGGTYLDYILRTPPEFLYENRPTDPSWMFQDYGYNAIGGFFELAEAYYNFGVIGCFVVPFLISLAVGFVYKKSLQGGGFAFFVFCAVLSVFPRGGWYQTFAFYKSFFTGAGVFFIVCAALFFARRFKLSFFPARR